MIEIVYRKLNFLFDRCSNEWRKMLPLMNKNEMDVTETKSPTIFFAPFSISTLLPSRWRHWAIDHIQSIYLVFVWSLIQRESIPGNWEFARLKTMRKLSITFLHKFQDVFYQSIAVTVSGTDRLFIIVIFKLSQSVGFLKNRKWSNQKVT